MTSNLATVLLVLLGSFILGVALTPLAVRLGKRFGLVVRPRLYGKSESAISYLGGPALALAAVSTYLLTGIRNPQLTVLLLGAAAVLTLGFLDDILSAREGIRPGVRFVLELGLALVLWLEGISTYTTGPNWLDGVVTVIFLVGAMNAFNLLDNMDGVAGMTATGASFGIAALALAGGQPAFALLAASVGGATAAFLCFNLVRPKAYLGDAGSLFLGLTLGGMALTINAGFEPPGNFLAAVVIFAVPFTDTVSRQLSRWAAGGSPFDVTGSTDHLSHRLVLLGFRTTEVARLHGATGLLAGAAAGIAALTNNLTPLLIALAAFAAVGLVFVALARNPEAEARARQALSDLAG